MNEILDSIASPIWWFSVIVVGIAVNLISAYVKPFLDRKMAGYSTARAQNLTRVQNERTARIRRLRESDRALFLAVRREFGMWLWGILLYALATLLFSLGNEPLLLSVIAKFIATILIVLGTHAMFLAFNMGAEIDESIRQG